MSGRARWWIVAALLVAAACTALTVSLFDRAYPLVDVGLRLTREQAIAQARALAQRDSLAPASARAAAHFESDDALSTFVDLAAGGPDSVRALARGRDVALFAWSVRLFTPGDAREALVRLAPDGRVIGMRRTLPEDERRPTVSEADGRAAADAALAAWSGRALADWRFVSTGYETRPRSGRVDRTYRYERVGRTVGEARIRAEVVVTGGARAGAPPTVLLVRPFVDVPESWQRQYAERRASNDFLALLSVPGMLLFGLGAVIALVRLRRENGVRWRPAILVGGTVGALMLLGQLNQLPLAWFGYDTATSPGAFVATNALAAIAAGVGIGIWVSVAVAAAEALTRRAFPRHYDWYGYLPHRGDPAIAARVLWGYALAAVGFAYVSSFYLFTRTTLGWWVPTGSLDDPNQIATPLPWVSAIGTSLFAGVWEEAIFRAVPLALLSLWVGHRAGRRWWMAGGVVVTALVFGFGHANYPSWPAYSRGAELFLEAALWAVLYLRAGLPTTIVAHVLFDLTWFGLFALHGEGPAYRTTAIIVVGAALLPAALVVQGMLARRKAAAPRMADWQAPTYAAEVDAAPAPTVAGALDGRRRALALGLVAVAAVLAVVAPRRAPLGPNFTAPRARIAAAADSALRAAGGDPAGWSRTLALGGDADDALLRRFLRDSLGDRARAAAALQRLATSYAPGPVWDVRYVRRRAPLAQRVESWRVVVQPDGRVRKVLHVLPEATPGDSLTIERARAVAVAGLAARGLDASRLREAGVTLVPRPRRIDATVEWEDPTVALPGGASARVRAAVVGGEVVDVQRAVKVPEAYERAERGRESRRTVTAGVALLLVASVFVLLLVRALRRVPRDAGLARRSLVWLGVAGALATLARQANGLETLFAQWPTEQPWTVFLSTALLTLVLGGAFAGAILVGIWALVDAVRRRAALPWVPTGGPREAAVAGAALGAAPVALSLAGQLVRPDPWPEMPGTVLASLVPSLAHLLDPVTALLYQPAALIGVLALLLAVTRPAARVAVLALLAAAAIAALQLQADARSLPATAGLVLAAVTVGAALVWSYGRGSVLAWGFAALTSTGLGLLRLARTGARPEDVVSGVIGLAATAALAALLWRWAARRPVPAPAPVAEGAPLAGVS